MVDVDVGNELFWYLSEGKPKAKDGFIDLNEIDLNESVPGLGLRIKEQAIEDFEILDWESDWERVQQCRNRVSQF